MTDYDFTKIQQELAAPFSADKIKYRVQATTAHRGQDKLYPEGTKGQIVAYVDARDVAERLDDVVGFTNWSFDCTTLPIDSQGRLTVKGALTVMDVTKCDIGYPNSTQDDEPLKSAVSDAIKRCAVLFGIGRHLYDIAPRWVKIDKYGKPIDERADHQSEQQATTQAAQGAQQSSIQSETGQASTKPPTVDPPITGPQQGFLGKLLGSDDAKAKMAEFLAREGTTKEALTKKQASLLIDELNKLKKPA